MDEPYEKKSFLIYKHFFMSIRQLSNEDLGLLFRTICEYQCDKDSLDYVDLVVFVEENFNVKLTAEDFQTVVTFDDFYNLISNKINE